MDESCKEAVKYAWEKVEGAYVTYKINTVGNKLLYWSKEKFDDLGKKIESTELLKWRSRKLSLKRVVRNVYCLKKLLMICITNMRLTGTLRLLSLDT